MLAIRRSLLAAAFCVLPVIGKAQTALYSFEDEQGVLHFSDQASDPRYKLIWREPRTSPDLSRNGSVAESALLNLLRPIAHQYEVEPLLVLAVIEVESRFNAQALSPKGAQGLMQLMPATAKRYGVRNPFNPEENLRGGIRYLKDLLARFPSLELALAAYNAGENAVAKYGNRVPPYPETRSYVPRVLSAYKRLSGGG